MSQLSVEVGQELPGFTRTLTRADLVRYAGASGDFNPIHYSDLAAAALGLPDVIAHGMLTMGTALRVVTDWTGDQGRVRSYSVRFTKPVVVPAAGGALVEFTGTVAKLIDDIATINIVATCDGAKVLGAANAEVFVG